MNEQTVFWEEDWISPISKVIQTYSSNKVFVVCGKNCSQLEIVGKIKELSFEIVWFDQFQVNPRYEEVVNGVKVFRNSGCKVILSIGGGSAQDVAKCIKLFASMDENQNYLLQDFSENDNILISIPTTAGTGSEATRFAVIYVQGEKQSVEHDSIIPKYVIMEPNVLKKLPLYQRKATMADALCHAVESYWSVHSTKESQEYSEKAIRRILRYAEGYLENTQEGNRNMLLAANDAGKAINITKTTAAHAMCYKLTSLYHIAHGHAAILCLPKLWAYMNENSSKCADDRGEIYVKDIFLKIAKALGCHSIEEGIAKMESLVQKLDLEKPIVESEEQWEILTNSVNPERLKNNPIYLELEDIDRIYKAVLDLSDNYL